MYVYSITITLIFAITGVLDTLNISLNAIEHLLVIFPFYSEELGWIVPAIVMFVLGYIIDLLQKKIRFE